MCSISFRGDVLRLEVDHRSPENLRVKPDVTSLNSNPGSFIVEASGKGNRKRIPKKSRALVHHVRDLGVISRGTVNLYLTHII